MRLCADDLLVPTREKKVFTRCRDGTRLARLDEDARIRIYTQTLSQTGKYRQGLFKAHIPDARAAVTMAAILYVCVCVCVCVSVSATWTLLVHVPFLIADEEKQQIKTTGCRSLVFPSVLSLESTVFLFAARWSEQTSAVHKGFYNWRDGAAFKERVPTFRWKCRENPTSGKRSDRSLFPQPKVLLGHKTETKEQLLTSILLNYSLLTVRDLSEVVTPWIYINKYT